MVAGWKGALDAKSLSRSSSIMQRLLEKAQDRVWESAIISILYATFLLDK